MNILFTAVGFNDPYSAPLIEGSEKIGVILSLLSVERFDQVVLVATKQTLERAEETSQIIQSQHPETRVGIETLTTADPTDHIAVIKEIREKNKKIYYT